MACLCLERSERNDLKDEKYAECINAYCKDNNYIDISEKKFEVKPYIIVESVQIYLKIIRFLNRNKDTIYRGQKDSGWKLTANLFRKDIKKIDNLESEIYNEIIHFDISEFQNSNLLNSVIHMQHYGLPTRLLDWTRNPLVALFFAADRCDGDEKNGKIYLYKPNQIYNFNSSMCQSLALYFEAEFYKKHPDDKIYSFLAQLSKENRSNNTLFFDPIYENDRLKAQLGLFSVSISVKETYLYEVRECFLKKIKENLLDELIKISRESTNILKKISKLSKKEFLKYCDENRGNKETNSIYSSLKNILENDGYWNIGKQYTLNDSLDTTDIIIPAKYKRTIKDELNTYGINTISVYPDLNGFVKYINESY